MLILSAVRTRVAAARRSVVPALLGAPTLRRAPSAFHVWPLHVTRRGGSPLHVKIGLAALSAAGAGFAAVKAVALSMPEATSQPLRVREASLLGSILGWPAA